MIAKLTCKTGPLAGTVYFVRDEATIGSSPDCTVHIRSGIISAKHARLFYDSKKKIYVLEDLKSFNGTRLDGEDFRGMRKLKGYHIVVLAKKFEFIFQLVPEEEEAAAGAPPKPAPEVDEEKMARTILLSVEPPVDAAGPKEVHEEIVLEFKTTKGGKQSIILKQGENSVGRSSSSDIMIDNPSISRHHAVVSLREDTITVKDVGSRNGTFVDDRRVSDEVAVTPENELRFGLVNAVLVKHAGEGRQERT